MSWRALALGVCLGTAVAALTFANDTLIHGTPLTGHHLPLSVMGVFTVLVLGVNPLLGWLRGQPLRPGELAVVVAIALVACAWPSFGFFRGFVGTTAAPVMLERSKPGWLAQDVATYVPGWSDRLGAGHVRDWTALARRLADAPDTDPLARLRDSLDDETWRTVAIALEQGELSDGDRSRFQWTLNQALAGPWGGEADLSARQRLAQGRQRLQAAAPDLVLPPPRGATGVLFTRQTEALDQLRLGAPDEARYPWQVDWRAWAPALGLWGGLALLLAGASLCLALIVHPQWSQRELLAYPIARFVIEASERPTGRLLPAVARQRGFWLALVAMVVLHGLNGLHAWFSALPHLPLTFNLMPLQDLFPSTRPVTGGTILFRPVIIPTAVAFCLFMSGRVALSLGLSQILFVALGATLFARGIPLRTDFLEAESANLLRFGAYVGMAVILLYVGRSYYWAALRAAAVGGAPANSVPTYVVWAVRGLAVLTALAVLWSYAAGLDPIVSVLMVGLCLLTVLVIGRIVAETGLFFVQAWWLPAGVLTALLGVEALGPTMFAVLMVGSVLLVGDPRTALMPYVLNGLRLVDRPGGASPGRLLPWLAGMVVLAFAVAAVAAIWLQHRYGIAIAGGWSASTLPQMPFDRMASHLADLASTRQLAGATDHTIGDLLRGSPSPWAWPTVGIGLGLLLTCAVARLRLPWWPLHPVVFLVWGTFPMTRLWFSFLMGWCITRAVTGLAGERGRQAARPVAVGIIAGELLMGLIWIAASAGYYLKTGHSPAAYTAVP